MANILPVKKIYCDTKFKRNDSKSNSNFKIDLPQTLKLPDNCVFYIDDVSIPNSFYTVELNINDKLYFRLQLSSGGTFTDYLVTLDSKTYNGVQFAAEMQSKITAITAGSATACSYDSQSKNMSVSVANFDINFFTDAELQSLTTWNGTAYNSNNLQSANELITNTSLPSPVGNTAIPAKFYLMLTPVRNIYMRSPNLSSFNTIGTSGQSNIIKKIPVNAPPGEMITSYITSSTDYLDCSNATWKTIEVQIEDVNGNEISLHGVNWSFSILLDIANANI